MVWKQYYFPTVKDALTNSVNRHILMKKSMFKTQKHEIRVSIKALMGVQLMLDNRT